MLKQIAASHAAKTLALCVCPVVTAGVVATKVPQVRRMVHKATAPKMAAKPERKSAVLSNVALPPCTPVAPFATLPRVAAALPSSVGIPYEQPGLTRTPASAPDDRGAVYNPGFGAPGAIDLNPGGTIGGGGGGIVPPGGGGGGGVIVPPVPPTAGVPEPETWLQILTGFALAGGTFRYYRIRRQRARIA